MCAQLLLKFFPAAFERLPVGSRHIGHVHTAKVYPEHAQCFAQLFSHSHVTKHKTAQLNTSKHINAHAHAISTNTHEPTNKHIRAHKHAQTNKHTVAAEHKHRIVSKHSGNFSGSLPKLENMRASIKICAPPFQAKSLASLCYTWNAAALACSSAPKDNALEPPRR